MSKGGWSAGLISALSDTANWIISSEIAIVIKDKYPKARHHYLVLSKEDISHIYQLKSCHEELLAEMHLLALNVIEVNDCWKDDFRIGFHAQPSMQRLHMHVISKDFVSPCLKTKKHWNSFNTKLFIPYEELLNDLREHGKVRKLDEGVLKELNNEKLKCNQCKFIAKNIPDLKEHLNGHLERNNQVR